MRIDNNFLSPDFIAFDGDKNKKEKTNMFSDILNSVSAQENMVAGMKEEYLNGERDDIDNILIESQKSNLQVSFALEVRNNIVDAVRQLTSMQI